MSKKKKLIIIISVVVIFGIAFGLGYLVGYFGGFQRGLRAGHLTAEIAEFTVAHEHLADQMANADCFVLKQTLNEYLALLEKYKDFEGGLVMSRTAYHADKMLTHARLARIERKLGNETEARNQMRLAVEACKQRGWQDCSEEKVISISQKFDKNTPIGCLSNSK